MSTIRVAINGFGRIGRLTARALLKDSNIKLVAINDISDAQTMSHLFKYDSVQGRFNGEVSYEENALIINDEVIYLYSCKDPANLPWKDLNIDVVIESTGKFRTLEDASKHITAGAKKVMLSAPPKSKGIKQVVLGINDDMITDDDLVVSNASCTTNCAAPVVDVIQKHYKIEKAILSTTHAYTSDQRLHDAPHKDLRRARAAAQNIIPTSTGASVALENIFPSLQGKLSGSALRVPVSSGSITELTFLLAQEVSADEVNLKIKEAAKGKFKGIMEYTEDLIVSSDIIGNTHSSVFDANLTLAMGNLIKVSAWYDNETGYSTRLSDLVVKGLFK